MNENCTDENGMIVKTFEECEKCPNFPCIPLIDALNAVVNGDN